MSELLKTYNEAIGQGQKYRQQTDATQKKLHSAQALIGALSDEKGR
jgi:hypothetical protein